MDRLGAINSPFVGRGENGSRGLSAVGLVTLASTLALARSLEYFIVIAFQ